MPALIPKPENFDVPMSNDTHGIINTRQRMPDGRVVNVDYFANLKHGYHLKRGSGHDIVIDTFGCGECRWINTRLCPHQGDVTHMKHHANGICSNRLHIPIKLHDEGYKMTVFQMLQVRAYMDAKYFADYKKELALAGKCDLNDCVPWEKIAADILKDMRKQDEGSKVSVERKVTPSDLANLIDSAKKVDVVVTTPPDGSNCGGDLDELRKAEEEVDGDED